MVHRNFLREVRDRGAPSVPGVEEGVRLHSFGTEVSLVFEGRPDGLRGLKKTHDDSSE